MAGRTTSMPTPSASPSTVTRSDSHRQYAGKHPTHRLVFGSSIVQVHVGDSTSEETFNLDRDLLASCSQDFKDNLESNKNGRTHVCLPDEGPLVFGVLFTFIAGQQKCTLVRTDDTSAEVDYCICDKEGVEDWDEEFLVQLYSFAITFELETFRNAVLEETLRYYRCTSTLPSRETLKAATDAIPDRSDDRHPLYISLCLHAKNHGRLSEE